MAHKQWCDIKTLINVSSIGVFIQPVMNDVVLGSETNIIKVFFTLLYTSVLRSQTLLTATLHHVNDDGRDFYMFLYKSIVIIGKLTSSWNWFILI